MAIDAAGSSPRRSEDEFGYYEYKVVDASESEQEEEDHDDDDNDDDDDHEAVPQALATNAEPGKNSDDVKEESNVQSVVDLRKADRKGMCKCLYVSHLYGTLRTDNISLHCNSHAHTAFIEGLQR